MTPRGSIRIFSVPFQIINGLHLLELGVKVFQVSQQVEALASHLRLRHNQFLGQGSVTDLIGHDSTWLHQDFLSPFSDHQWTPPPRTWC